MWCQYTCDHADVKLVELKQQASAWRTSAWSVGWAAQGLMGLLMRPHMYSMADLQEKLSG